MANDPRLVTVFTARNILTMDPSWPTSTAIAVRDGRILSVGSLDELKPWLTPGHFEINDTFKDKVLMPGFIEAHGHPLLGGMLLQLPLLTNSPVPNPYGAGFAGLKTRAEAMAAIKKYESALTSPATPLYCWGFDSVVFGGHLTRVELDQISMARPIFIWDASEHFAYLNSAAIASRKFTPELAKSIIGVKLGSDGELNGQFLGTNAAIIALGPYVSEQMKPEFALKHLDFMTDLSRKRGITTQSELVLGVTNVDEQAQLYELYFGRSDSDSQTPSSGLSSKDAAPMRCVAVTDIAGLLAQKGVNAVNFALDLQKRSSDKLMFRGVKSFADDSFLGLGMAAEHPGYVDDHHGIYINRGDEFFKQLQPFWTAGLQIHIHTNGDGGHDDVIDVLTRLQHEHPRFNHRFTFQHFGIANSAQIRSLKALGAIASVNPYYVYHRAEVNAPYMGTDRAYTAAKLRSLWDAGVLVSLHSDTPIGPPDPLEWVWIAVNRFGQSGKVLAPDERVSVHQAMQMVTINAAYTLGVDDKIGSLEPGKFADFAVLDENPYEVEVTKIREIKVSGTVVGGKISGPISS